MIVFVHIERTGGSKIHGALQSLFPERHIVVGNPADAAAALGHTLSKPDRRWYIGGHIRFADLTAFLTTRRPSDILFSTTRNPLERTISLYYLTLRSPSWLPRLFPFAERSFADFYAAVADNQAFGPNAQCRFLAGTTAWSEARDVIRHHYNLVGVHHHYRRFLERLQHLLRTEVPGFRFDGTWRNTAYHQETEAGAWKRRVEIDELVDAPTRRRIERDNDADYALVEFIGSQPGGVFDSATPTGACNPFLSRE